MLAPAITARLAELQDMAGDHLTPYLVPALRDAVAALEEIRVVATDPTQEVLATAALTRIARELHCASLRSSHPERKSLP